MPQPAEQHTPLDLHDLITELTAPHTVTAHYVTRVGTTWIGQNHRTKAAGLLWQLAHSDPSKGSVEGATAKAFESTVISRTDALDLITHIREEVAEWLDDLGWTTPPNLADAIRLLGSLAVSADKATAKEITYAVRGWWIQARVVTGWDSPAWSPDNTCPACEERRTVRIRAAERIASCIHCRAKWDESNISLLADHIRRENDKPKPAKVDASCWCPLPLPMVFEDMRFTCGKCGSPKCRWALVARIDWITRLHTETNDTA